jgi:hypothetical protein
MFTIVVMTLVFVAWAFLSFFVHILVAIFFPVVSGALLGIWIYMWRNTQDLFQVCGTGSSIHYVCTYKLRTFVNFAICFIIISEFAKFKF